MTRRATRATQLRDENAVKGKIARGVAKAGTAATVTTTAGPSKESAILDANVQNKRKREALGEVTNNNKDKAQAPKGISKEGKIVKPHVLVPPKATRQIVRGPLRKVRSTAITSTKENDINEDAMLIDEPPPALTLHRVTRKLNARTTTTEEKLTELVEDVDELGEEEGDYAEGAEPAHKRRRTSSEGDVEAAVETELEVHPDEETATAQPELEAFTLSVPDVDEEEEEEVTGWDDLDKDDFDDPYMVSEYVVDIFKYLCECENQSIPNADYMQHQKELRWSHRGVLMDYLIGLHSTFKLMPETLYLSVNIIDRFLSMRVVSLSKLQLVGLSGLLIAAKFEEIVAPSVENFLVIGAMQDEAKEEDMLKAERYILKTLNWSVSLYPQPMNWLRRVSKADDYDPQVRALAKFFLEIHVVERRLIGIKPSLLAAASIWLGRLVMGHFGWSPNLAHYSGYSEKKILPVADLMLNYCLRPERHENFVQKFASKKYSKVLSVANAFRDVQY
ncbi:A/B/D/E cyclin [Hysterangium stoloniferum]|nr:A/B/D/E cyclin [Hysterangium stoloniferum]